MQNKVCFVTFFWQKKEPELSFILCRKKSFVRKSGDDKKQTLF
jgi:hypothetical protein